MAGEFLIDLRDYRKFGVIDLAVDVDRHKFLGCLFDLGKELLDTGRFAGTGETFTDGV